MKISLNWIKQYVDLPHDLTPEDLADRLTVSTVEVEEVIFQAEEYSNMVVGEILDIVDHPQADKLKVLKVNAGSENCELQVICGATNIYKGMKSVLALTGARIKWHGEGNWMELNKTKIRGVESEGMLCAPEEVGLTGEFDVSGVIELKDGKPGQPISDVLGLNDVIFEIDNISITHRPDLWGHYGMAREIAALYNLKLKDLTEIKIKESNEVKLEVKVENPELCPRYQALAIGKVKIQPSPFWLKQLLKSVGVRPINNIVDITNYVMLKLGQPIHAFDRRQILNNSIFIKTAKDGDNFTTLDEQERQLNISMLMIADAEKDLAIAGIMGGKASGIVDDTTEIIIESANFNPISVRKTSVALGLRTDASARFEKSLDPCLTEIALNTVARLIFELNPEAEAISKIIDVNNTKTKEIEIELSYDLLFKRLGQEIPRKEVVQILEKLEFKVKEKGDILIVKVPSFRATKDISIPEDLVEEVARIYGYDNIQPKMPLVGMQAVGDSADYKVIQQAKDFLAYGLGATEVYNYSFVSEQQIKLLGLEVDHHLELANYLTPNQRYLRLNLFEGLVKNMQNNLRASEEVNFFEVGRIFSKEKGEYATDNQKKDFLIHQPQSLAGLMYGKEKNIFLKAKGLVEQLLEYLGLAYTYNSDAETQQPFLNKAMYLEIMVGEDVLGFISGLKVNNSAVVWQLNLDVVSKYTADKIKYQSLPKYPGMVYDFSIIVPISTVWADLRKEVMEVSKLVKKVELFDTYKIEALGPDLTSLSFHVNLLDENKTLTSAEGDKVKEKIYIMLKKKFTAEIR